MVALVTKLKLKSTVATKAATIGFAIEELAGCFFFEVKAKLTFEDADESSLLWLED